MIDAKTNGVKKILIVENSSWTIYKFRLPLIKALKRNGFEVVITSPIDEYIHYLNETDFNKHIPLNNFSRIGKNPIQDLFFLFELRNIFKTERPDLVISFTLKPNIYSGFVTQILGLPFIAVVTGLGYTFLHQNGIFRWIGRLYKLAFRKIQKLIVYNQSDYDYFTRQQIVDANRCHMLPGEGIDTDHFLPVTPEKTNDKFTFLFIGRLIKDKGLHELVEAARLLQKRNVNFEVQLVGDMDFGNPSDVDTNDLLHWIESHQLTYLGSLKDVRPAISSADVIVLPSYREGLSRVILEAMSMAKPVITTDTAGCIDLIEHNKNGLIVPVKNAAALAEAMEYMAQLSKQKIIEMGQANRRKVVQHFDEGVSAQEFLGVVREVLERNHKVDLNLSLPPLEKENN